MLQYELIKDKVFMGESPPVLYVYGSTSDFHELAIIFLPFLKNEHYCITSHDIDILKGDGNIIISFSNEKSGISISEFEQSISVALDRENWIDIIIGLVTLSSKSGQTLYSDEYLWLNNFKYTVILETT